MYSKKSLVEYCNGRECSVYHKDGHWREVNMNCYLFKCSECKWITMIKSYCYKGDSRYLCATCFERLRRRTFQRKRNVQFK